METPITTSDEPRADDAGERCRRVDTTLWWVVLGVFAGLMCVAVLVDDFRERPLLGDNASHLMQGVSLAEGANLSYEASDHEAWVALGWDEFPRGLYLQQRSDGSWAFAKPYGYSVWLAPFLAVLPAPLSVNVANALLFLAFVGLCGAIVATRYSGPVVPIATGAFAVASYAAFYAFTTHPDLFLATVSALFCLLAIVAARDGAVRLGPGVATAVVGAFLLAEKPTMLLVVLPVLGWLGYLAGALRPRAALGIALVAAYALFVVPYLYYSDGSVFTPYGGDRHFVLELPPFTDGGYAVADVAGEQLSLSFALESATSELGASARAVFLYVFGRHTGIAVFMPAALAFSVLAAWSLWDRTRRRRDTTRHEDPDSPHDQPASAHHRLLSPLNGLGLAFFGGLALYALVYCAVFPFNYYGGGQSLGNRYFLQVAPFALAGAVMIRPPARLMARVGAVSIVWALVALSAHMADPSNAFTTLDRRSAAQRIMPFESGLEGTGYFLCGRDRCLDEGVPEP